MIEYLLCVFFLFILKGVPVWTGRKMYTRYRHSSRLKRNFAIAGGVLAAVSIYFSIIIFNLNHYYINTLFIIIIIIIMPLWFN